MSGHNRHKLPGHMVTVEGHMDGLRYGKLMLDRETYRRSGYGRNRWRSYVFDRLNGTVQIWFTWDGEVYWRKDTNPRHVENARRICVREIGVVESIQDRR